MICIPCGQVDLRTEILQLHLFEERARGEGGGRGGRERGKEGEREEGEGEREGGRGERYCKCKCTLDDTQTYIMPRKTPGGLAKLL